jgi:hypothetical protein
MMPRIELLVVVVALATVACWGPSTPADTVKQESGQEEPQQVDKHAEHRMHEGAITFSHEGQTFRTTVLGGLVGTVSVHGIRVSVHVLQAESPDRLKSTGSGPTHLFNLTFVDEESEELIREASGTVKVTAADGRQIGEAFEKFASHFQARVRLDHPGEYRLQVDFESGSGSGVTDPLPFDYRRKGADAENRDHEAAGH